MPRRPPILSRTDPPCPCSTRFRTPRELLDRFVFAPPYQEEVLTEGRFLAFLRNARVAGHCHLVYSAENTVYQDTLICSRLGAPPMRDFATQYEKTLMREIGRAQV